MRNSDLHSAKKKSAEGSFIRTKKSIKSIKMQNKSNKLNPFFCLHNWTAPECNRFAESNGYKKPTKLNRKKI